MKFDLDPRLALRLAVEAGLKHEQLRRNGTDVPELLALHDQVIAQLRDAQRDETRKRALSAARSRRCRARRRAERERRVA